MQIVVHRGFHLYNRENSIMAIMTASLFYEWVEFDVIYVEGVWRLCHDVKKLRTVTEPVRELVKRIMKRKCTFMIDIKWDFLYSDTREIETALAELSDILRPLQCTVYIQSIVHAIYSRLSTFFPAYQRGIVLPACPLQMPDDASYIMADIHQWDKAELNACNNVPVFGYTCSTDDDMRCVLRNGYRDILYGIVCDIPEN